MNKVKFNKEEITPSKVICIGKNYIDHIKELNGEVPTQMVIFNKPNSSITHKLYHFPKGKCHHEAEISFLIFDNKIKAVGFGLDLTKRKVQKQLKEKGLPWERAKAFDKSAVFSQFVEIQEEDIPRLSLELYVNDNLRQSGGYELMINKPLDIIKEILTFMTIEDGDIIMTGTPKGVGEYKHGDLFKGKILVNKQVILQKEWVVK